jgi:hypothetical protein
MAFRDRAKTGSLRRGKFTAIQGRRAVLVVPILFLFTGISTKSQNPRSISETSPSLSEQGKERTRGSTFEALYGSSETRRRGLVGRIQHYVGTHKELLAADTILWVAQDVDAGVTAHCISVSTACMETNPIVGHRPSPGQLFGGVVLIAGTATILTHLAWHLESNSPTSPHDMGVECNIRNQVRNGYVQRCRGNETFATSSREASSLVRTEASRPRNQAESAPN